MLIKNATLRNKTGLWDIAIQDGNISEISRSIDPSKFKINKVLDLNGNLVIQPFIEPHIHLDTVLTAGEPCWNVSGTLFEGIKRWGERKQTLSYEDVKNRAMQALKWMSAQGIQFVRSHVDITDPKLIALKTMLDIKHQVKTWMDIQLVAFPQEGIHSYPRGLELLEESVKMGVDVIGGIPHFEFTREYGIDSLKNIFKLSEKYNKLIDIHCDEIDDEQSRFVETVADLAYSTGIGKMVTASHTTAMHSYNNAYTCKLFRLLKLSKINFVANPLVNIHLQGRFDTYPKRRGITRVKEMLEDGINVCFGHDDIFDHWYPMGTGNMLQVLHMGLHVCQMMGYEEINDGLDLITVNSSKTLHIEHKYGIEPNKPGNLIVLSADSGLDAIRRQSMISVMYSIRNGKVIAETKTSESHIFVDGKKEQVVFKKK